MQAAVRNYIRNHRPRKRAELAHFAQLDALEDAITWAALGMDERGKRHAHQRRLTQLNLDRSRHQLLAARDDIEPCRSFSELLALVYLESGRIKGLGDLYCYDTALRLGAYLGLAPERIYLHAGTRAGARALGFDGDAESISLDQLPDAFWRLEPYEVEDLLCIYKDLLKRIAD